jgi:HAD superfamily phosphoserine phosphatase-like hydrolase
VSGATSTPDARRPTPRFRTVILDVDSTLSAIEGIDWLARNRGGDLGARIAMLTDRAMNGEIALDAVYGERLALVRPTRAELDALGDAYVAALSEGAREAVAALQAAGARVVIVSGGLRHAILPLARHLGVPAADVHAVRIDVDDAGEYAGFDESSPLAREGGKLELLRSLDLPRPVLGVGDGITDAEMKPALDAFALFTGHVRREVAARAADVELASFAQLVPYVVTSTPPAS